MIHAQAMVCILFLTIWTCYLRKMRTKFHRSNALS
jgi:hypothetical protein